MQQLHPRMRRRAKIWRLRPRGFGSGSISAPDRKTSSNDTKGQKVFCDSIFINFQILLKFNLEFVNFEIKIEILKFFENLKLRFPKNCQNIYTLSGAGAGQIFWLRLRIRLRPKQAGSASLSTPQHADLKALPINSEYW